MPQERDMAVRMIDVPAAGRARDRGGTIDIACGPQKPHLVYPLLCAQRFKTKPPIIGDQTLRLAFSAERRKDRRVVPRWVWPPSVSPNLKVK